MLAIDKLKTRKNDEVIYFRQWNDPVLIVYESVQHILSLALTNP